MCSWMETRRRRKIKEKKNPLHSADNILIADSPCTSCWWRLLRVLIRRLQAFLGRIFHVRARRSSLLKPQTHKFISKQCRKKEIEPSPQMAELRTISDNYMTSINSINSSAFSTWPTNRSMWTPDVWLCVLSFTECCSFRMNIMTSRMKIASGIIIIKNLLKKSLS